jgi:hypothetical protein
MPAEHSAAHRRRGREKPDEEALRKRIAGSVERILELVGPAAVSDALAARSGFDSMSRLLDSLLREHPEAVIGDPDVSPHLRLMKARRDLLERAGGTYDTSEVADLLGISPEGVRKRIQRGALLAYKSPAGEYRLPRAQFSAEGVVLGLERVLEAMHVESSWMRIQLFLDDDVQAALADERIEDAVRAVTSYLVKGEELAAAHA